MIEIIQEGLPARRFEGFADIEAYMKQLPQAEVPAEDIFSAGVYIRQITAEAGTLLMGERHKQETCNVLLSGEMVFFPESGAEPFTLEAPALFTSPAGAKKFAYCITSVVFATIHANPTLEKDPVKLRRRLTLEG